MAFLSLLSSLEFSGLFPVRSYGIGSENFPKEDLSSVRTGKLEKMEQNETGCEASQATILCVNNCGFFGTTATMNMCSKCYKDMMSKQEQAKLAASSIESIVNGNPCSSIKGSGTSAQMGPSPTIVASAVETCALEENTASEKVKEGPVRCNTCRKRVGLTGFNCRCGNTFCAIHRYSDKHDCPFDYRAAAQDAIARGNPVVKADKLDKI